MWRAAFEAMYAATLVATVVRMRVIVIAPTPKEAVVLWRVLVTSSTALLLVIHYDLVLALVRAPVAGVCGARVAVCAVCVHLTTEYLLLQGTKSALDPVLRLAEVVRTWQRDAALEADILRELAAVIEPVLRRALSARVLERLVYAALATIGIAHLAGTGAR